MRLLLLLAAALALVCLARAGTAPYGRTMASFDELRNTRPTNTYEPVYLLSYHLGLFKGGGVFVGFLSADDDDGGFTASNGSDFHWDRKIGDLEELNVLHWGAYHDGVHDDHDAVLRMVNWGAPSTEYFGRNGVRFVAGSIYFSPIDVAGVSRNFFALYGPTSPSPYGPVTTILSDGSNRPVFNITSRFTTVRGIAWDGRATATVDPNTYVATAVSNKQPFLRNNVTGGEYFNVDSFYATRTGGIVFILLDTIDTKFSNIETYNTYSNLWNISWSYQVVGVWDHSTAVEVNNMHITNSYGDCMLNATRMGQGLLRNIYIKKCRNPGNFENSQWVVDNFYVEDCKEPFGFLSNRDLTHNMQLVNATIKRGTSPVQWLGPYDQGWIQANSYGLTARAPFAKLWKASLIRGSNNQTSPLWVEIGTFRTNSTGGVWKIEALSRVDYRAATYTRPTANGSGGRTNIMLQRGADDLPVVTFGSQGYAAVTDVAYKGVSDTHTNIWAKIAPNCGEYAFFVRGTGTYRLNISTTGMNLFLKSGATSLSAPSGYTSAAKKASLHNGSAGYGAERGLLTVDTTANATLVPGALAGHTIQKVNGVNIASPYYHINPVITASPSLTTYVAAGNKLTLSVTASYAISYQWQYGDTPTDINGAVSSTYVVTSASSSNAGKYRVLAIGSEGRTTAATSRTVTVTVT